MRVPINLASDPFRRDRSTLVASGLFCALLVGLLVVQTGLILAERQRAAENRDAVGRLNTQLNAVSAEQTGLDRGMRQQANVTMAAQSLFLNALIDRKAISWARLFADIESVMPNDVKLIQVRLPQINASNQVTLDMEIGAKQPGDAINLFQKLESSPLFGPVGLQRDDPPNENEPLHRYRFTVNYGQKL